MKLNTQFDATHIVACSALAALLAFGAGCGGGTEPTTETSSEEAPSAMANYQPTGNEGTVTGTIHFEGEAPTFRPISMEADAACAAKHSGPVYPEAVVLGSNNTLQNVFVYVKSGLGDLSFAVPSEPVELDQDGCMYIPHVLGLQAQQNLEVVTNDDTTHNIHPIPTVNREWNVSQPPGAEPIVRSFSRPEASIPVKCNQHPWMTAYLHVLSHPFFSVSGSDGTFEISGLPPGTYEIEAIHEHYGAMTQQVTVEANGSETVDFNYNADMAYQPGSLEMLPALVLP